MVQLPKGTFQKCRHLAKTESGGEVHGYLNTGLAQARSGKSHGVSFPVKEN